MMQSLFEQNAASPIPAASWGMPGMGGGSGSWGNTFAGPGIPSNMNDRYIVYQIPGGQWGIWDMRAGGLVNVAPTEQNARTMQQAYSRWGK